MPTPAKLICAVLFAALAWWTAETIVREVLPEGTRVGRFREWLALAGLVIGWRTIGRACTGPMGRGTTAAQAVTAGIAGAAILTAGGLLVRGFTVMIAASLDRAFTEVGQAASAWMGIIWRDAGTVADPVVLGTLFGGAAVVGLIGGMAGRMTR